MSDTKHPSRRPRAVRSFRAQVCGQFSLENARTVVLTVPVSALAPGDYIVRLSGAD